MTFELTVCGAGIILLLQLFYYWLNALILASDWVTHSGFSLVIIKFFATSLKISPAK